MKFIYDRTHNHQGVGVTAVLQYLLLPRFGLMGAAIASAAAYFAESLVVYGLRRKRSISPRTCFAFATQA